MFGKVLNNLLPGRLAVVQYSGVMSRKNVEDYLMLFKGLEESRHVRGVLLELESPGGSATASEVLYDRLERLGRKKPVFVYALLAASGGYMAALAAKRIFAPSTAIIGSIGVISIKPVLAELMQKLGVGIEVIKKGDFKDMTLFHRRLTDEERGKWDALNEAVYERFVYMVSEKRGIPLENARELATGEIFIAQKALEHGLIDGVMDYESALDELAKETGVKKRKAVAVRPKRPFMKRLMSDAADTLADELLRRTYWG